MATRRLVLALLALLVPGVVSAQRLPRTVVPAHYDITLSPDLGKAAFAGEEVIDVELPRETATIVLNAAEIAFGPVFATSGPAGAQSGARHDATVTTDAEKEMATLTFVPPIPAGAARLHIAFTGTLNDKLRGFYLSKGQQRNYAATQFEATDARRAFPCFDEPDLKATSQRRAKATPRELPSRSSGS